tara:strand:- start:237 stop:2171 length:1935 start_codon:yes stop_codon:yes gene_type:complete
MAFETREEILAQYPKATEQQIQATLIANGVAPDNPQEDPSVSLGWGTARSVFQGATFGFSDEITAALRSIGSDLSYEELRDEERQKLADFREAYPGVAMTSEIVGGLLVPGLGVGGTLAKLGVKGANTGYKLAATGAAEGGLYGLGATEQNIIGEDASPIGAAIDAGIGAGSGGVAAPVVGKVLSAGQRRFRGVTPAQETAGRTMKREMEASEVDPDIYRTGGAEELRGEAGDVLADAPVFEGLSVASLGPQGARHQTRTALAARQAEERDRVSAELTSRLGTWTDDADEVIDTVQTELRRTSPETYRIAYEMEEIPVAGFFTATKVDQLTSFEKNAYNQARREVDALIAASKRGDGDFTELDRLPALSELDLNGTLTTRALHEIKKRMDDVAWGERGSRTYKTLTKQANDALKAANPEYAIANKGHEVFQKARSAVEQGKKFMRMNPPAIRKFLEDASPENVTAFRSGILTAIKKARALETQSLADYVGKNTEVKKRLRAAFESDEAFEAFLKEVGDKTGGMVRQRDINRWLFGGSPTQPKLQQSSTAEVAIKAGEGATYSKEFMLMSMLTESLKSLKGKNIDKQLVALNEILFRHPGGPQAALNDINRFASASDRNLVQQILTAGSGAMAGSDYGPRGLLSQ